MDTLIKMLDGARGWTGTYSSIFNVSETFERSNPTAKPAHRMSV